MNTNLQSDRRATVYTAALAIVALIAGFGLVTDTQSVAVGALAVEFITLAFAAVAAFKHGAPLPRQAIYAVLTAGAGVATVFGVIDPARAGLIEASIASVIGVVIAFVTTQPKG